MSTDEEFEDRGDGIDYNAAFETDLRFESRDAAVEWCRNIAIQRNFLLRISTHKKNYQYLECDRSKKKEIRDMSTAIRKHTARKGTGCKFRLWLVPKDNYSYWLVGTKKGYGCHNHRLIVYPEGHRQISGLSPSAKKVVGDLSETHVKPRFIMKYVNNSHPNLNPNMKHIYNCRHALRKARAEGRNAAQQFLHEAIEKKYLFWILSDQAGQVTHTFAAHPSSVKNVRTWPQVIHIDATYKTNRYKFPLVQMVGMAPTNKSFPIAWALMEHEDAESYRWLLERLKNLIGMTVNPNVILTDRDLGLIKYISDVFPFSAHLLCTWHIKNDVEAWVASRLGGNRRMGIAFGRGSWSRVLNSATVDEYNANVAEMMDLWGGVGQGDDGVPFPQYITGTWLVHKEKFVACWTNHIRHFGSHTNNRVESMHSSMKGWIGSATEAMDTLFKQVHSYVENQLIELRNSLEASMRKECTEFDVAPWQYLNGVCSLHCLKQHELEFGRLRSLEYDLSACGCVAETTHGFPCMCNTFFRMQAEGQLYIQDVDPFWYSLVIGSGVDNPEIISEAEQDRQYFMSLVNEVESMDPSMMRHISSIIHDELHPDRSNFEEPRVKATSKGRGKMKRGMERCKTRVEHVMGTAARSKSSTSSRSRSNSSNSKNSRGSGAGWRYDVESFPYRNKIPVGIHESIEGWYDVIGDGNCGFRCVAETFCSGENDWDIVRRSLVSELHQNAHMYEGIYGTDVAVPISRIRWEGNRCGPEHYMDAPSDFYPIANHYRCSVFFFSYNSGHDVATTVLPLDVGGLNALPQREIAIAFLGNYRHFILLQLKHGHPIPPIDNRWWDHATHSVYPWAQYYSNRIRQYQRAPSPRRRSSNTRNFVNLG